MLSELNDLRDEARSVELPEGHTTDIEKVGAVISLVVAIAKLVKIFTGPKGDKAMDYIVSIFEGIAGGAIIIKRE